MAAIRVGVEADVADAIEDAGLDAYGGIIQVGVEFML